MRPVNESSLGRDLVVRCSLAPTKIGAALNENDDGGGWSNTADRSTGLPTHCLTWPALQTSLTALLWMMERMERMQVRKKVGREEKVTTAGRQKQKQSERASGIGAQERTWRREMREASRVGSGIKRCERLDANFKRDGESNRRGTHTREKHPAIAAVDSVLPRINFE